MPVLNRILNADHNESITYLDLTDAIQGKSISKEAGRLLFSLLEESYQPQKIVRYEGKKKDDIKAASVSKGEQRIVHEVNGELLGLSTSIHVVDGKFYLFQRQNNDNTGPQNEFLGGGQNGEVYSLTHEIVLDHQSKQAQIIELSLPIAHKITKKDNLEPSSIAEFAEASQKEGTTLKEADLLQAIDPQARRLITRNAKKTVERTYMSYYPGQRLSNLLMDAEPPLSFEERLQIADAIALALTAFHDKGIVHGDINLDNILIEETDAGFIAHLIDIEEPFAGKVGAPSTAGASRLAYTSDEVLTGKKFSLARDITAMGLVYYELLTTEGLRTRPQGWIASFSSKQGQMSALSVLKPNGPYESKALTSADILGGTPAQRQAITSLISRMVEKPILGSRLNRPDIQEVQVELTTIQKPVARHELQQVQLVPMVKIADPLPVSYPDSNCPGLHRTPAFEEGPPDFDIEEGIAPVPVKTVSFQDYQKELHSYIAEGKLNNMYELIYERVLDRLLRDNPIRDEEIGIIKAKALKSFHQALPPITNEANAVEKEVGSVQRMMQRGLNQVSNELKSRNNPPQPQNTFSASRYLKQAFESIKEGFRILAGTSKKVNPGQLHAALFGARNQMPVHAPNDVTSLKVGTVYK